MPVPYAGRGTAFGFMKESVWGTPVARTNWLKAVRAGLARKVENQVAPHLFHGLTGADIRDSFQVKETAGGSIEVVGRYVGLGYLLEAAMGSATTSGAGPTYNHTFALGNVLPALTIEQLRGTSAQSEVFSGCKVRRMNMKLEAGGVARFVFDFIGKTAAVRGAAGSPTFGVGNLIKHHESGVLTFNAVQYTLQSLELDVDNKLAELQELGSLLTSEPDFSAYREVRLKLTLAGRNSNLYNAHLLGTVSDATITLTGLTPDTMTILLRSAIVWSYDDAISSTGVQTQTVELLGFAAANPSLEITIANNQANYWAN